MLPTPSQSRWILNPPRLEEPSLFSYQIRQALFRKKMVLTLQQQETHFTLTIQLYNREQHWIVTKFTINEVAGLEERSLSLYDAALIDLMIQGLHKIFEWGQQKRLRFLKFQVPTDEWVQLSCFESFFYPVDEESCLLSLKSAAYQNFKQQTGLVHLKVQTELWKRQRGDLLVKAYLQERCSLIFTPSIITSACTDNVIAFPGAAASKHLDPIR